jgi:hypothetical protein
LRSLPFWRKILRKTFRFFDTLGSPGALGKKGARRRFHFTIFGGGETARGKSRVGLLADAGA